MASSDPPPDRPQSTLLVVDDDADLRSLLVVLLLAPGRRVDEASSAAEARASLAARAYDVVITDLSMPGESGLSLMQWALEHRAGSDWIVLTGHGTLDAAVRALQLGAFDFLEKPLQSTEALQNSVRNALAQRRLRSERDRLHLELEASHAKLSEHVAELEEAYRMLRERADNVRADLHRAGIIQRALLPERAPRLSGMQVHALYRPSQSIGGDIYDVVSLDEHRAVLLIADAAGHGLAAAMLAVLFRSHLRFVDPDTRQPRGPREMLRAANVGLCEGAAAPGLFLTAAYCLVDTERRRATVASAGHPPLLLLRKGGDVERLFHTGPALGLYPEADYAEHEVAFDPGDRLLCYSDGVYDWLPGRQGSEGIAAAMAGTAVRGAASLRRLLSLDPDTDEADMPEDDTTLLLLEVEPGPSVLDNGRLRAPPAAPIPLANGCEIQLGRAGPRCALSIEGSADWARSAVFHAACVREMEAGRGLIIDLARCRHLDSTFLGAFHELSERAEEVDLEFRLQGVAPDVEALFAELGMKGVMDHVVSCMLPLPTHMEALAGSEPAGSQALLTLRAHEILASLNDRNRREFDPLLTLLRRELGAESS